MPLDEANLADMSYQCFCLKPVTMTTSLGEPVKTLLRVFLLNKFLPTEWNTKPNEQHDSIVIYTIKKSIRFVEENTPTARKHKYTHTTRLNGPKKERLF